VELDQVIHESESGNSARARIRLDRQPDEQILKKIRAGHTTITGIELTSVAQRSV
jgi:hypothetical protein